MELNGGGRQLSDEESVDGQVETVVGAGYVGTEVARYEGRIQQPHAAQEAEEMRALRMSQDRPVTREEAVAGMQHMEHRAAQAIAGAAAESAHAVSTLAQQTATAVDASHQAVTQLHSQTAQAFSTTEDALTSMQDALERQQRQMQMLQDMLHTERRSRIAAERKAAAGQTRDVVDLSRKLEEALARIDEMSADLASAKSDAPAAPMPIQSPAAPRSVAQPTYVPPPQFTGGVEITAPDVVMQDRLHIPQDTQQGSLSLRSRHSRRSRSPSQHSGQPDRDHSRRSSHSHASTSDSGTSWRTSSSRRRHSGSRGLWDTDVKPKDPPTFAGRTNDDPEAWCGQVSNFFRLVGGSAPKQVAYASTLLHGSAQTWWQRKVRSGEEPKDWSAFQEQLLGRFQNVNKSDSCHGQSDEHYGSAKKESAHDYICRFESRNGQGGVVMMSPGLLKICSSGGCLQDQAVLVSQQRPKTLEQSVSSSLGDAALAAQMAQPRPGGGQKDEKAGGPEGH